MSRYVRLLVLGAMFFLGWGTVMSSSVFAAGGVNAACPQSGATRVPEYIKLLGNKELKSATCQTQIGCNAGKLPGYNGYWDYESPECDTQAADPLGCCMYFKDTNQPVVSAQECVSIGAYCSKTQCAAPDTNIGRCGTEADFTTPTEHCCRKGAAATTKPADAGTFGSPSVISNPLGTSSLFVIINRIITAFLGMVGAFAFAVFIYAGVTWMTAGSSDRVQHAKDTMKYAVIGLAMIALSYAITIFMIGALTRPASVAAPTQPEAATPVDLE
jgi:hypothetical protein